MQGTIYSTGATSASLLRKNQQQTDMWSHVARPSLPCSLFSCDTFLDWMFLQQIHSVEYLRQETPLLVFQVVYLNVQKYFKELFQNVVFNINWAGPWGNLSYDICEQQRCRSACASAQSDQRLYCSLHRWYYIFRFYSRNFSTLASFCGCAGRFESDLVRNCRRHIFSWRGSIILQPALDNYYNDYFETFHDWSSRRYFWRKIIKKSQTLFIFNAYNTIQT